MNHIANAVYAAEGKSKYDAMVKELVSDKQILAWILKYSMREFRNVPIKDIIPCIEGEPEVGAVPVYPGLTKEVISGRKNESKIPNEGTITFDIRFYALTPNQDRIRILINVELQKEYYPGYDIVPRGIFYCARMLSAQMDTEFTPPDYNEIKKAASIWVCMDCPAYAGHTITEYSLLPQKIYGNAPVSSRYDLLSVVTICLAKEEYKGKMPQSPLHGMLETLLSDSMAAEEKLLSLNRDYGIEITRKMDEEVCAMCNLSDRIEERGIRKGIERGLESTAKKLIRLGSDDDFIQAATSLSLEHIGKLRQMETAAP